jgi:hypothetical protein
MPIEHADRQPSEALNTIARTTLSNLVLKVAPSTLATWKLEGVSDFALVMFLKITLMTFHFKHRHRNTLSPLSKRRWFETTSTGSIMVPRMGSMWAQMAKMDPCGPWVPYGPMWPNGPQIDGIYV